MIPKKLLP